MILLNYLGISILWYYSLTYYVIWFFLKFIIIASFTHILRLLVSEFTLAENPANTVTSKLRYVCKNEEGILLGICPVQHAHHQTIEDQVIFEYKAN